MYSKVLIHDSQKLRNSKNKHCVVGFISQFYLPLEKYNRTKIIIKVKTYTRYNCYESYDINNDPFLVRQHPYTSNTSANIPAHFPPELSTKRDCFKWA